MIAKTTGGKLWSLPIIEMPIATETTPNVWGRLVRKRSPMRLPSKVPATPPANVKEESMIGPIISQSKLSRSKRSTSSPTAMTFSFYASYLAWLALPF